MNVREHMRAASRFTDNLEVEFMQTNKGEEQRTLYDTTGLVD